VGLVNSRTVPVKGVKTKRTASHMLHHCKVSAESSVCQMKTHFLKPTITGHHWARYFTGGANCYVRERDAHTLRMVVMLGSFSAHTMRMVVMLGSFSAHTLRMVVMLGSFSAHTLKMVVMLGSFSAHTLKMVVMLGSFSAHPLNLT